MANILYDVYLSGLTDFLYPLIFFWTFKINEILTQYIVQKEKLTNIWEFNCFIKIADTYSAKIQGWPLN